MRLSRNLLKTTQFYSISLNQYNLTQFHKIQQNFTKTSGIYCNADISKGFMKFNKILLKSTEFYRISFNSLQILLQISLQILL